MASKEKKVLKKTVSSRNFLKTDVIEAAKNRIFV